MNYKNKIYNPNAIQGWLQRISGDAARRSKSKSLDSSINDILKQLLGVQVGTPGSAKQVNDLMENLGNTTSAYTSAQMDGSMSGLGNVGQSIGAGMLGSLFNFGLNQASAAIAYQRQNQFYDEHISMPAKVREYQNAGLNPMALAGAGVGATSAPQVNQGAPADASGLVASLLEYKSKMRELDIQDKAVDADIDLKKSNEVLNYANVDKVFSETDKISAEAFIVKVQGRYVDSKEQVMLSNLLADLGVKDATITKYDAEAASAWADANLKDITSQYQGALMEAKTKEAYASAVQSYAIAAKERFTADYMRDHNGANPPAGMIGSVAGLCSEAANRITNGISKLFSK